MKTTEKPPVKKWTEQDEAAKKIQKLVRGFLGRVTFTKMKKEKQEYEDLMDKLEREVNSCQHTYLHPFQEKKAYHTLELYFFHHFSYAILSFPYYSDQI